MRLGAIKQTFGFFFPIVLLIGFSISIFKISDGIGSFHFNSYLIAASLLWIAIEFGLFSIPFILSFILFSVTLVPIAAEFMGYRIYSGHNIGHQLNSGLTDLHLYMMGITVMCFICYFIITKYLRWGAYSVNWNIGQNLSIQFPFYLAIILYLICCYGMEPGRTLLSTSYEGVIQDREETAAANLFGVFSVVFWIIMYLKYRSYCFKKILRQRQYIFVFATIVGITWLFLHARRSELIGYLLIGLFHIKLISGKVNYKYLIGASIFIIGIYLLGFARGSDSLFNVEISEVRSQALNTSRGFVSERSVANIPSGLGNITESMQTTLYHFNVKNEELLKGQTIVNYPIKLIPSNILSLFGISTPVYYHHLVLTKYSYLGGTYILAPAYGNFGLIGLVISGILFAWLISTSTKLFYSQNMYKIAFSSLIIFYMIKLVWYGPVPFLKAVYSITLLLFFFQACIRIAPKSQTIYLDNKSV